MRGNEAVRVLIRVGVLCAALLAWLGNQASASVEYSRREHVECGYCHTSQSPGYVDPQTGAAQPTGINKRGIWYQSHNHSFAGYRVPEPPPTKRVAPIFHIGWQEEMDARTRRACAGDLTGDGVPRLVTLSEAPGTNGGAVLTIRKWNGATFAQEFQHPVAGAADRLAVGRFAGKDKPAVIVVGDGLWYHSREGYLNRPAANPLAVFGTSRMKDGSDRLLLADTPSNVKAYTVAPSQARWLVETGVPRASELSWGDMHATPEFFSHLFPASAGALVAGGLIGVWDSPHYATPLVYYVKLDQDFDITPDPNNPKSATPKFVLKSLASYLLFKDSTGAQPLDLWATPRLPGAVYDVIWQSPKSASEAGFAVLTSASLSGTGRCLFFFAFN